VETPVLHQDIFINRQERRILESCLEPGLTDMWGDMTAMMMLDMLYDEFDGTDEEFMSDEDDFMF